jgi:hypothetical protein
MSSEESTPPLNCTMVLPSSPDVGAPFVQLAALLQRPPETESSGLKPDTFAQFPSPPVLGMPSGAEV